MIWRTALTATALFCCVGVVARADDRPSIFLAQAQSMARLATTAEGLVRCGVRSERWSEKVQEVITVGVTKIAQRLWTHALTDPAGEGMAYDDALGKAYDAIDAAAEVGHHVTPQWCIEIGSSPVPAKLDEFVGGSE